MNDRLRNVVAQVFGVPVEHIHEDDGPHTIESWDSLAHINLVLALEAEFGVSLAPDDAAEMLSVGLIRQILWENGIAESEVVADHR